MLQARKGGDSNETAADNAEAVSYTHLDVYKRQTLRFHFTPLDDCADKVLDILHGTAGYNGTPLFKDIEMHIKKGETVGPVSYTHLDGTAGGI